MLLDPLKYYGPIIHATIYNTVDITVGLELEII